MFYGSCTPQSSQITEGLTGTVLQSQQTPIAVFQQNTQQQQQQSSDVVQIQQHLQQQQHIQPSVVQLQQPVVQLQQQSSDVVQIQPQQHLQQSVVQLQQSVQLQQQPTVVVQLQPQSAVVQLQQPQRQQQGVIQLQQQQQQQQQLTSFHQSQQDQPEQSQQILHDIARQNGLSTDNDNRWERPSITDAIATNKVGYHEKEGSNDNSRVGSPMEIKIDQGEDNTFLKTLQQLNSNCQPYNSMPTTPTNVNAYNGMPTTPTYKSIPGTPVASNHTQNIFSSNDTYEAPIQPMAGSFNEQEDFTDSNISVDYSDNFKKTMSSAAVTVGSWSFQKANVEQTPQYRQPSEMYPSPVPGPNESDSKGKTLFYCSFVYLCLILCLVLHTYFFSVFPTLPYDL